MNTFEHKISLRSIVRSGKVSFRGERGWRTAKSVVAGKDEIQHIILPSIYNHCANIGEKTHCIKTYL